MKMVLNCFESNWKGYRSSCHICKGQFCLNSEKLLHMTIIFRPLIEGQAPSYKIREQLSSI